MNSAAPSFVFMAENMSQTFPSEVGGDQSRAIKRVNSGFGHKHGDGMLLLLGVQKHARSPAPWWPKTF